MLNARIFLKRESVRRTGTGPGVTKVCQSSNCSSNLCKGLTNLTKNDAIHFIRKNNFCLPRSNRDVSNVNAGKGNVNESIPYHLQFSRGSNWDGLIQCDPNS
jgi:hypothetical protein